MPRKKVQVLLTVAFLICVLPTVSRAAEKRVALIIGNGVYGYPNALKNPAADASDMELALKQLGFEVFRAINLNKQQTEKLIDDFSKRLAKTRGVGLFYYSGIGIQKNSENFLVPIDANLKSEEETLKSSIPLGSILSKMTAAKSKRNIILLDAVDKYVSQILWLNRGSSTVKIGFAKIPVPPKTTIFYSAENGKTSIEHCGRNGVFVAAFLRQLENPLLELGQLTEKVAADVVERTGAKQKPFTDGKLKKSFYFASKKLSYKSEKAQTLDVLFENFKLLRKCECGNRAEAIAAGKEIGEKFKGDTENSDVLKYVMEQVASMEKDDPVCRRNGTYDAAYKAKDWIAFFRISKEIIAQEGESPLALDIMLTLVSVGYDRVRADKNDSYNAETIDYAKQAIRRLESGGKSQTGNWGVFLPFKSKDFPDGKTNALNCMNYIIGWITHDRLGATDAGKKREGIGYFYKSTQYKGEFSDDLLIYTRIGDYYFAEVAKLDKEYRDIRAANNNTETAEAKAKRALALGYADRALDAFGRALKTAVRARNGSKMIDAIKKILNDLYRFRFDIPPEIEPKDVDVYVEKLISQPLPPPESTVEPVSQ